MMRRVTLAPPGDWKGNSRDVSFARHQPRLVTVGDEPSTARSADVQVVVDGAGRRVAVTDVRGVVFKKKCGRKRLYTPYEITEKQQAECDRLIGLDAKRRRQVLADVAEYRTFCLLNGVTTEAGFTAYFAQIREHLAAGSCKTRLQNVKAGLKAKEGNYAAALAGATKNVEQNPAEHARDAPLSVLKDLVARTPMDYQDNMHLFLLATFGIRVADLLGVQGRDVKTMIQTPDGPVPGLVMELRTGKTRSDPKDTSIIAIPLKWIPFGELGWRTCSDWLKGFESREYLRPVEGDIEDPVVSNRSTCALNYALRKTILGNKMLQEGERMYTTYTFRRNFLHRMALEHMNENGLVDWDAVISYTAHHTLDVPKSIYALKPSDMDDEAWAAYDPRA